MNCQKCGALNDQGMRFCTNCGVELSAGNVQYQGNTKTNGNYGSNGPGMARPQESPAVRAVKNTGASPLFLAGTIAYSVYLLLYFISSIWGTSGITSYLARIAAAAGADYMMQNAAVEVLKGASIITAVVGMIPLIIIAVGLWLIFAAAKKQQIAGMSTAGLTMIKVIYIIKMVCSCISAVSCVAAAVILFIWASDYSYYAVGEGIGIIFLFCAVIFGIVIFYHAKVIQSVNTVKKTIMTGTASDKISAFVGVIAFISGGVTVISSFFGFSGLGFLTNLCSAASSIIFGMILFQYRKIMGLIMNGGVVPERINRQPSFSYQPSGNNTSAAVYQSSGNNTSAAVYQSSFGSQQWVPNQPPVDTASETMVLSPSMTGDETMVLSREKEPQILGYLVRSKTNESVAITKERFMIGKSADTDFCVSDNPAVSRKHAEIVYRNGAFYVIDKASTNHVYVNGNMIQSEMEIPVAEGTIIGCGNEEFVLKMGI